MLQLHHMKEMMFGTPRLEKTPGIQLNPTTEDIRDVFKKSREFIKTLPETAKIGLITLILTAGVFESVSAQTDRYDLDSTMTNIKTGKTNLGTAVSDICSKYKMDHANALSAILNITQSFEHGTLLDGSTTVSGEQITLPSVGDTIRLGDAHIESFSASGIQNQQFSETEASTNEYLNSTASIKIIPTPVQSQPSIEKLSVTSMGKTPAEATLSALMLASGSESSVIHSITANQIETDTQTTPNPSAASTTIFTSETNNTIHDVSVVVTKIADGYSAQVMYR